MIDDQVTMADAFAEVRKHWTWIVVGVVLGVSLAFLLGYVRGNDQWAASHRLRLVRQASVLSVNGLPTTLAADRSASGEASYLTASGVRDLFGDDDLGGAEVRVSPGVDGLVLVINAFASTANVAESASNRFRDAYVESVVSDDNERLAIARTTEQVRLKELDKLLAGTEVPAEVLLARADSAARSAALQSLPTDGSFTVEVMGPIEGPTRLEVGRASRRQLALAGMSSSLLIAFLLGVRGLRSPRLRYASDVGNSILEQRVLGVAPRPDAPDLDLAARVLRQTSDKPVSVVPVRGAGNSSTIEALLRAADLTVVNVPATEISSLDTGSQVVLLAGYRRTSRAHLRRVIHELHLVGAAPTLILIAGVSSSTADTMTGRPKAEDE